MILPVSSISVLDSTVSKYITNGMGRVFLREWRKDCLEPFVEAGQL